MQQEEEEGGGGAGWIVSYADLMTLLFATFVVLYGLKTEGKSDEVLGVVSSIREAFIEIPDDIPTEEKVGPIKKGKAVFRYFKAETNNKPIIKRFRRAENAFNVINEDLERVEKQLQIFRKRNPKIDKKAAAVYKDPTGFKVRLTASYFYKAGEYRMDRQGLEKLAIVGGMLKDLGRPITVEGHTDNTPSGGGLNNWDLSSLRASYALRHLVNEVGFPEEMISAAGYADKKPVADNRTPAGRNINRRIEIKVHYDELQAQ